MASQQSTVPPMVVCPMLCMKEGHSRITRVPASTKNRYNNNACMHIVDLL